MIENRPLRGEGGREIAANWRAAGITPDKSVAFYFGTGWRASETWFYAYLMGWPRTSVYDGGWFEWSKDPISNPTHFGDDEVDKDVESAMGSWPLARRPRPSTAD